MEIVIDDYGDITRVWYKFDQFGEIQNPMVTPPFALKSKAPIVPLRLIKIKKNMGVFFSNKKVYDGFVWWFFWLVFCNNVYFYNSP